jgi:hypothetical protein
MKDKRIRQPGELSRMVKRPAAITLNRRSSGDGPSETLQAAVLASLVLGMPSAQVALQFGLSTATVRRWQEAYDISNPLKRRDHLSEMLMIFLEQEIASLMTISIATQDEEWILKQNATELSTFTSMKQDRLMQLLQAFGKAQASREVVEAEVTYGD